MTAAQSTGATYDALALKQLLAPVRARTARAQRIQLLASAATVVPFIGVVELGRELLAPGRVSPSRAVGDRCRRSRCAVGAHIGERGGADDHAFRRCAHGSRWAAT